MRNEHLKFYKVVYIHYSGKVVPQDGRVGPPIFDYNAA